MPNNRPDPGEFLDMAQRMLRELFTNRGGGEDYDDDEEPWAQATRTEREARERGPSPKQQRENLTFALATRAVEALEDLALNVAAIRQRLERTGARADGPQAGGKDTAPDTTTGKDTAEDDGAGH
jgi:hypothetical protein